VLAAGGLRSAFQASGHSSQVFQDHVPAGDEGLYLGEPERLKQRAQVLHLDGMAANIDCAEKRDIPLHHQNH